MAITYALDRWTTSTTTQASVSGIAAPSSNAAAAGTLFYIAASCAGIASSPSVTDTKSNVYTLARQLNYNSSSYSLLVFYSKLAQTLVTGTDTITVNFGVSTTDQVVGDVVTTGVDTLDRNPVGTTGNSSAPSISSGTLSNATELLITVQAEAIAAINFTYAADTTHGWDPSYDANGTSGTNPISMAIDYQAVSVVTSVTNAPPTFTAGQWGDLIHSFYQNTGIAWLSQDQSERAIISPIDIMIPY